MYRRLDNGRAGRILNYLDDLMEHLQADPQLADSEALKDEANDLQQELLARDEKLSDRVVAAMKLAGYSYNEVDSYSGYRVFDGAEN